MADLAHATSRNSLADTTPSGDVPHLPQISRNDFSTLAEAVAFLKDAQSGLKDYNIRKLPITKETASVIAEACKDELASIAQNSKILEKHGGAAEIISEQLDTAAKFITDRQG